MAYRVRPALLFRASFSSKRARYVLMVLTLRQSSSAISETVLPDAMFWSTCISRSERLSCAVSLAPVSATCASFSATLGLIYFRPLMMRWTAVRSSSVAVSLLIKPDAPALSERIAYWSSGCMLHQDWRLDTIRADLLEGFKAITAWH